MEILLGMLAFLLLALLFVRWMWKRIDTGRRTQRPVSRYAGMTTNERLLSAGRLEAFDEAARRRDADTLVTILLGVEVPRDQSIAIAETVVADPERFGFSNTKIDAGPANST